MKKIAIPSRVPAMPRRLLASALLAAFAIAAGGAVGLPTDEAHADSSYYAASSIAAMSLERQMPRSLCPPGKQPPAMVGSMSQGCPTPKDGSSSGQVPDSDGSKPGASGGSGATASSLDRLRTAAAPPVPAHVPGRGQDGSKPGASGGAGTTVPL